MIKTIVWSVLLTFSICSIAQGKTLEKTIRDRSEYNTECSSLDLAPKQNVELEF